MFVEDNVRSIAAAELASRLNDELYALTFRFAVIDEAFGRGSGESTRFALELFRGRPSGRSGSRGRCSAGWQRPGPLRFE